MVWLFNPVESPQSCIKNRVLPPHRLSMGNPPLSQWGAHVSSLVRTRTPPPCTTRRQGVPGTTHTSSLLHGNPSLTDISSGEPWHGPWAQGGRHPRSDPGWQAYGAQGPPTASTQLERSGRGRWLGLWSGVGVFGVAQQPTAKPLTQTTTLLTEIFSRNQSWELCGGAVLTSTHLPQVLFCLVLFGTNFRSVRCSCSFQVIVALIFVDHRGYFYYFFYQSCLWSYTLYHSSLGRWTVLSCCCIIAFRVSHCSCSKVIILLASELSAWA